MKVHAGILDGSPRWDEHEVTVLAITPGIPLEWIHGCLRNSAIRKSELKRLVRDAPPDLYHLADENAASVELEDGWLMLKAIPATYKGAVPLYSQLWLKASTKSVKSIAFELGRNPDRVAKWRRKCVFDPLTGVRIL